MTTTAQKFEAIYAEEAAQAFAKGAADAAAGAHPQLVFCTQAAVDNYNAGWASVKAKPNGQPDFH